MCHYFKLIANVGHIADKLWTLLMPVAVSSFQPRSSFIGGLPEVSHLSNFSNHFHSSKVVHFDQTVYLNIWKFSDSWFTQLLSIKAGAAIISKSPNWRSFLPKKTMAQIIFLRVLILWTCFPSFQRKKYIWHVHNAETLLESFLGHLGPKFLKLLLRCGKGICLIYWHI